MGLMDKFKNLFTDEEFVEEEELEPVEIKEIKKEEVQQLPTFMREKIEQEKQEEQSKKESDAEDVKIKPVVESQTLSIHSEKKEDIPSFKFPMDFSEQDFIETRSRQSVHQKKNIESEKKQEIPKKESRVADLYKDKKTTSTPKKDKIFKATPIISPIYGILDKNYTHQEVEEFKGANFEEKRHSKTVDFDSVRKKAYGSLSEEIKENLMCENCEYLKEAKECRKKEEEFQEDNLVYDVLEESASTKVNDITLDEASENYFDYGVAYERNFDEEKNLKEEKVKIINHVDKPKKINEIPPVKSSINLLSTLKKSMGEEVAEKEEEEKKNLELTDDLFNLIDSMYDERNDVK